MSGTPAVIKITGRPLASILEGAGPDAERGGVTIEPEGPVLTQGRDGRPAQKSRGIDGDIRRVITPKSGG